ncbi:2a478e5e-6aa2-434c-aa69-b045d97693fa [Sclerotinia trifoliorum]|uniref:2a478e5e-6aa2-434c-aa69-b045d97693fa n=1 Tax=Sclerotinia trifoliorum TaxID=28548 RepID=A0A8H2VKP1_9HELO|nr:2a478e5e-6aa2-434c-aa69-b045d97693fa [Sclerotinia trifoliorum]
MATWGAYFSSYVKKNPGGTPADKESEPTITPIVPLDADTDVKTIEPLILEEDKPIPNTGKDVEKRFDEKLGSVGNLGMGTASVTRMPTLRSNSRGARMAKMFGYGTAKGEKVEEKGLEDKEEVGISVVEVKEIKTQVAPEMSKIEKLMAERKAAAIESRTASLENTRRTPSPEPVQTKQPPEQLQVNLPERPPQLFDLVETVKSEPLEPLQTEQSVEPLQLPPPEQQPQSLGPDQTVQSEPLEPVQTKQPLEQLQVISPVQPPQLSELVQTVQSEPAEPATDQPLEQLQVISPEQPPQLSELVQTVQSQPPEPSKLSKPAESISRDSLLRSVPEKSKSIVSDTPTSTRFSFKGIKSSTKRASTRSNTKASISALDDLMAGFGEDFANISVTSKPAENEKGVEKTATGKPRNQRKQKASISALDDIMAGLYSMETKVENTAAPKPKEVRKVDVRKSEISTMSEVSHAILKVLSLPVETPEAARETTPEAAPEILKEISQTPKSTKKIPRAVSRFPVVVSEIIRTTPNLPAPIVTTDAIPATIIDQLSLIPLKTQIVTQPVTKIPRSPIINGQLSPIPTQFRLRPKRSFKDMVKLATSPRLAQVAEQAIEAEAERKLLQYERQAEQMLLEKEEMEEKRMSMEESFRKMQEEDERISREADEIKAFYGEQERMRIEMEAEEERARKETEAEEERVRKEMEAEEERVRKEMEAEEERKEMEEERDRTECEEKEGEIKDGERTRKGSSRGS